MYRGRAHSAPRTMILFDPDLEPDPKQKATSAKRLAAATPRTFRLPSARTLTHFLKQAQVVVRLKGEVTVLLTTDAAICKLNARFRGKNQATDVLSFPAVGPIPGFAAKKNRRRSGHQRAHRAPPGRRTESLALDGDQSAHSARPASPVRPRPRNRLGSDVPPRTAASRPPRPAPGPDRARRRAEIEPQTHHK